MNITFSKGDRRVHSDSEIAAREKIKVGLKNSPRHRIDELHRKVFHLFTLDRLYTFYLEICQQLVTGMYKIGLGRLSPHRRRDSSFPLSPHILPVINRVYDHCYAREIVYHVGNTCSIIPLLRRCYTIRCMSATKDFLSFPIHCCSIVPTLS